MFKIYAFLIVSIIIPNEHRLPPQSKRKALQFFPHINYPILAIMHLTVRNWKGNGIIHFQNKIFWGSASKIKRTLWSGVRRRAVNNCPDYLFGGPVTSFEVQSA